jgi:hypothetical protein
MNKSMSIMAVLVLLAVGMVSAVPSWTVDKSVVVTGDYKWVDGWTLPSPAPRTATYDFVASGTGMDTDYAEAETLGSAWKYKFNNELVTDGPGAIHSFAWMTTVNDPRTTPGTAFTDYAFGTHNQGTFTESTVVVSGLGFADISHSATFNSAFTSQNFVCVNDCAAEVD